MTTREALQESIDIAESLIRGALKPGEFIKVITPMIPLLRTSAGLKLAAALTKEQKILLRLAVLGLSVKSFCEQSGIEFSAFYDGILRGRDSRESTTRKYLAHMGLEIKDLYDEQLTNILKGEKVG